MGPIIKDRLDDPAAIKIPGNSCYLLAGNAWQVYQEQLPATLSVDAAGIIPDCYPQARAIAEIAAYEWSCGRSISAMELEPQYLRNKVASKKV